MPLQTDPEGVESKFLHDFADIGNAHVLEIGCGDGRLTWQYAASTRHVTAIDPAPIRLAAAQKACPSHLISKLTLAQVRAEALPYASERFDLAVLSWSLWWMSHAGMVHALQEIWRVLIPGKCLIDLRPRSGNSRVEVVAGEQVMLAGLVDESADLPDDFAADKAVAQLTRQGWLFQKKSAQFDYTMYWDSTAEMKAYIRERWTGSHLPETVVIKSRRFIADNPATARLRIRRQMMIACYQKIN